MLWKRVASWHWTSRTTAFSRTGVRHSGNAQRCYASRKGTSDKFINRWSEEEDEKILQLRADGKLPNEMLEHLPGRTIAAIGSRMYGGLREKMLERGMLATFNPALSKTDIARIRTLRSQNVPWREILLKYPGRSLRAVKRRVDSVENHEKAGEHRKRKAFQPWEDELLLRYRQDEFMRWPEIFARIPGRSRGALWNRYQRLARPIQRRGVPSVNSFTKSEVDDLIRLRESGLPWAEVARRVGKKHGSSVRKRYLREKHFKDKEPKHGPWTEEEDRRLRSLYGRGDKKGYLEDAVQELHRSPTAIMFRVWELRNADARP